MGSSELAGQPAILPDGDIGGSDILIYRGKNLGLYMGVAFFGTSEVEGIAQFEGTGRFMTRSYFVRQLRGALAYAIGHQ